MLFELGQVVTTSAAQKLLEEAGTPADTFLARHRNGDCGDFDKEERDEHWQALVERYRFISVYRTSTGSKVWIITERDRGVTTIFVSGEHPEEEVNAL
jgi:hypothetical protein